MYIYIYICICIYIYIYIVFSASWYILQLIGNKSSTKVFDQGWPK